MKYFKTIIPCAVAMVLAGSQYAASGTIVIKTETFNSALSARTNNWWDWYGRYYYQDFGFSATTNCGGPAGEAGGHATRTGDLTRPFYMDIFGAATGVEYGALVFTSAVTNGGSFIWTKAPAVTAGGDAFYIGHGFINTTNNGSVGTSQAGTYLERGGLSFGEAQTSQPFDTCRLFVSQPDGNHPQAPFNVYAGTNYTWSWSWDPLGGVNGKGRVVMTLTGTVMLTSTGVPDSGTHSVTNDMAASFVAANYTANGFGLWHGINTDQGRIVPDMETMYVDNVTYTAATDSGVPCMKAGPSQVNLSVGFTNSYLVVSVPPVLTATSDFYVTVTTADANIAIPAGAVGGVKEIRFAAGGLGTTNIYVTPIANNVATTTFTIANTNGICVASTPITIKIGPAQVLTTQALETFDTAATARADGWWEWLTRLNGNDYGWSNSASVGFVAGEAGGKFVRNRLRSGYCDAFAGTNFLTLNDSMTVTGRFFLPTPVSSGASCRTIIGYQDWRRVGLVESSDDPPSSMGFELFDNSSGRLRTYMVLQNGSKFVDRTIMNDPKPNTWFDFSFSWNPNGGISGNGELIVTIKGTNSAGFYATWGSSDVMDATARATGANFGAFGFGNRTISYDASQYREAQFDNVYYTTTVLPDRLPAMKTYPSSLATGGGSTNQIIWLGIPPALNASGAATVTVTSLDPSVAVPVGGNPLVVTFAAGADNVQPVYVQGVGGGSTRLAFSNSYGLPVETNEVAVNVFPGPGAIGSASESFTTAGSAAADGWVESQSRAGGQNFGFSDTGNASGVNGEIGGTIVKANGRSYYGAVSCSSLSLNDPISANGKLYVQTDSTAAQEVNIGHFNSADGSGANNLLGIRVVGPGTSGNPNLGSMFGFSNGTTALGTLQSAGTWINYTIDWNYSYNPYGGVNGLGQLTMAYMHSFDSIWRTNTLDLTLAQRTLGATFNSFGVVNRGGLGNDPTASLQLYVDEVTYTVGSTVKVQDVEEVPVDQLKLTFCSAGTNHVVKQSESVLPTSWSTVPSVTFAGPTNLIWTATFAKPSTNQYYRIIANP